MIILIIKFCKIKIILTFPTEFRFWLRNSIMVRRTKRSREKNVEKKKTWNKKNNDKLFMKCFILFYFNCLISFTSYINKYLKGVTKYNMAYA